MSNNTTYPVTFDATFDQQLPASRKQDPAELLTDLLEKVSEAQRDTGTEIEEDETLEVTDSDESVQYLNAGTVLNSGDILSGDKFLVEPWELEPPKVRLLQETRQAERGPGQGQPAEFYIWSDSLGFDLHSADGHHFDSTGEVDIWIVTLEDDTLGTSNRTYRRETVQFLSEYINDNESNTPFINVQPSSANDQRAEHITGTTDHHASVVTVEIRDFRATGL